MRLQLIAIWSSAISFSILYNRYGVPSAVVKRSGRGVDEPRVKIRAIPLLHLRASMLWSRANIYIFSKEPLRLMQPSVVSCRKYQVRQTRKSTILTPEIRMGPLVNVTTLTFRHCVSSL